MHSCTLELMYACKYIFKKIFLKTLESSVKRNKYNKKGLAIKQ